MSKSHFNSTKITENPEKTSSGFSHKTNNTTLMTPSMLFAGLQKFAELEEKQKAEKQSTEHNPEEWQQLLTNLSQIHEIQDREEILVTYLEKYRITASELKPLLQQFYNRTITTRSGLAYQNDSMCCSLVCRLMERNFNHIIWDIAGENVVDQFLRETIPHPYNRSGFNSCLETKWKNEASLLAEKTTSSHLCLT